MNNCCFIGNLTRDVDVTVTSTQKKVAKFSLAINNGKDKDATFLNFVAWEGTAELLEKYCQKGSKLGVVAKATVNSWTDKEGNKRQNVEFLVNSINLLGSPVPSNGTKTKKSETQVQEDPLPMGDDLPF